MNRNIYMTDLRKLLAFLTEDEREAALRQYEELFDRAGEQGEQKVIAYLGSPTKLAVEIHRDRTHGHTAPADFDELLRTEAAHLSGEALPEQETLETEPASGPEAETSSEHEEKSEVAFAADEPEVGSVPAPEAEAELQPEAETEPEAEPEAEAADEHDPGPDKSPEAEIEAEPDEKDEHEPVFVELPVPQPEPGEAEPLTEDDDVPARRAMPGWAVALILISSCWLWIPVLVVLLVVGLAVVAVPLSAGLALTAAAGYLGICGIWALGVISDALLMFGAAAISLALGLVLLWLAVWALIWLIRLLIRGIRAVWRGVFRRGAGKERAR